MYEGYYKKNGIFIDGVHYCNIQKLDIEQAGALLRALFALANGEELPGMDKETDMVFDAIAPTILNYK